MLAFLQNWTPTTDTNHHLPRNITRKKRMTLLNWQSLLLPALKPTVSLFASGMNGRVGYTVHELQEEAVGKLKDTTILFSESATKIPAKAMLANQNESYQDVSTYSTCFWIYWIDSKNPCFRQSSNTVFKIRNNLKNFAQKIASSRTL